ncbi:hypothetical protein DE146DRAFT_667097, partial [Phaeosphaeria sp. MPI-PUGE-AT-0046c]
MCWQSLACISSALVEGDNIGPQDVSWANAERARAHPCAYVRSQTTPYGARSPEDPMCRARAVPNTVDAGDAALVAMQ